MAGSERADEAPAAAPAAAPAGRETREGIADAAATAAPATKIERHNIRFDATGEIAYHSILEGALDRWHRIVMTVIIISGAASFADIAKLLPDHFQLVGPLSAFLVVLASTLDFTFDLPGAAREHRDIRGRLRNILATLETCADPDLPALRSKLQEIYASEPPTNRYVQALGYNTAVDALYDRERAKQHYEPLPPRPWVNPLLWVMRVDSAWVR